MSNKNYQMVVWGFVMFVLLLLLALTVLLVEAKTAPVAKGGGHQAGQAVLYFNGQDVAISAVELETPITPSPYGPPICLATISNQNEAGGATGCQVLNYEVVAISAQLFTTRTIPLEVNWLVINPTQELSDGGNLYLPGATK